MPLRAGIDLVSVQTVRDALGAHGERYLARVFTEGEVADCSPAGRLDAERLAARFAAKEAALKTLRPGRDEGLLLTDIEVRRHDTGWVGLALSGRAAELAERAGIAELSLSISHEAGIASAVVIAEIPSTSR